MHNPAHPGFIEAIASLDAELETAIKTGRCSIAEAIADYDQKCEVLIPDATPDQLVLLIRNGALSHIMGNALIDALNTKAIPAINTMETNFKISEQIRDHLFLDLQKRIENDKKGAQAKKENDPKQKAKLEVKNNWEAWMRDKSRYKSKSAFARDMLDKYETLGSQKVIESWCTKWEREVDLK